MYAVSPCCFVTSGTPNRYFPRYDRYHMYIVPGSRRTHVACHVTTRSQATWTYGGGLSYSADRAVPIARYSACLIAWHRWEQQVVSACGVVPVAALVPMFPSMIAHTGTIKGPLLSCTASQFLYEYHWYSKQWYDV